LKTFSRYLATLLIDNYRFGVVTELSVLLSVRWTVQCTLFTVCCLWLWFRLHWC